ncbi:MAG: polysaccharide pyruvyl transferase family protein [Muribaculaceae bacterium]|nr:polysaccharide pyruvyl transferase family protein [Muribaculaceae bacterium]
MRIGIVTQPLEMNYGGILQNWALQQVLKRLGHDPITIDAYQRFTFPHYVYSCFMSWWMTRRGFEGWYFPHRYHGSLRRPETGRFVEKHIAKTRVMWDYDRKVLKRYGMEGLIVGSDQVWRPGYNQNIEDKFLQFAEGLPLKRRIAYAVSFGVDEWTYTPEQTTRCSALAQQFDAVSVREESAVALCRDNLGINAQLVLDPTLLLDADDYQDILDADWDAGDPYLAVYVLDITQEKKEFFDRLAKERGLRVRFFSAGLQADLTIGQWLAMFRHATMLVTDSFHGTVFSILFGKEFYTLENPHRGNTRIAGLLGLLGLESRLLSDKEPDESHAGSIDWQDVYSRLGDQRQKSMEFLSSNL